MRPLFHSILSKRSGTYSLIFLAVALTTFHRASDAQPSRTAHIEILPESPTPQGEITARLSGVWPDACVPSDPTHSVSGNEIRIETSTLGEACPLVITPWELTLSLGKLPEGRYEVVVNFTTPFDPIGEIIGRLFFDVRPVSVQPMAWGQVKERYRRTARPGRPAR